MNINLINEYLKLYLEDTPLESFNFIKQINEIVRRNAKNTKIFKYKEKININASMTYAYKFFKSINSDYAQYFAAALLNETFYVSESFGTAYSYYNYDINKKIIEIPYTKTIVDSYTIVHETLHDMNQDAENLTISRKLITESISMLGEMLFEKFLIENKISVQDNHKTVMNNFKVVNELSDRLSLELYLIYTYKTQGYIDLKTINNIYQNFNEETINEFIEDDYKFNIYFDGRYILGALISSYMYDRIIKNPKMINEFFDINNAMNDMYVEDIFTYLNLDYKFDDNDSILFTDESLNKLEKTYKKVLKKV